MHRLNRERSSPDPVRLLVYRFFGAGQGRFIGLSVYRRRLNRPCHDAVHNPMHEPIHQEPDKPIDAQTIR